MTSAAFSFSWLRFAERLGELARFAAGLHSPVGADEVAAVAGALYRTAANLIAHVEAV